MAASTNVQQMLFGNWYQYQMCNLKLELSAKKKFVVRLESLFGAWNEVLASLSVFFFYPQKRRQRKKVDHEG